MNQKDVTSSTAESSPDDRETTESPIDSSQDEAAADQQQPSGEAGFPRGILYLTLLIALLAAAGMGYQWNEQRTGGGLSGQLKAISVDLDAAKGALKRLTSDNQRVDDQLKTLTAQIDDQLGSLPARVEHVERTLDTLPGITSNARSTWLLAEVEYLLRVANVQLNLAGNIDISLKALDFADEKLTDLGDPSLIRVRAMLNDERAALRAVPRPDTEGIVISLGSLSRSIDGLPLRNHAPDHFGGREKTDTIESGWQRAWRVIVDALFSIISVKRDEEPVTPLMSDAGRSTLIRSLDLDIQTAKLAVLRTESTLFRESLQTVADRLESYFDTDAQSVKDALESIHKLLAIELPQTLPDISGSLNLLMQVQQTDKS